MLISILHTLNSTNDYILLLSLQYLHLLSTVYKHLFYILSTCTVRYSPAQCQNTKCKTTAQSDWSHCCYFCGPITNSKWILVWNIFETIKVGHCILCHGITYTYSFGNYNLCGSESEYGYIINKNWIVQCTEYTYYLLEKAECWLEM